MVVKLHKSNSTALVHVLTVGHSFEAKCMHALVPVASCYGIVICGCY